MTTRDTILHCLRANAGAGIHGAAERLADYERRTRQDPPSPFSRFLESLEQQEEQ